MNPNPNEYRATSLAKQLAGLLLVNDKQMNRKYRSTSPGASYPDKFLFRLPLNQRHVSESNC